MPKVDCKFAPATLSDGSNIVDVTVTFVGFPKAGTNKTNRPHVAIAKNDVWVHEDQPFFNGAVYQLDPERIPVKDGDTFEVIAWWAASEVRSGATQAPHTVGEWAA